VTAFLRLFQRSEWGLLLAIAVVLVLTTVLDAQHTYWTNPWPSAVDVLRQTSLLGIFALGAAIVIISGGIDLSSGSVIAFSGSICATIIVLLAPDALRGSAQPLSIWVIGTAIAGTVLVGLLIGSLHAWLITVIRLPPFIATLATLVGLRSFARVIVENVTDANGVKSTQIQIFDEQFRYLATSVWIPVLLFALFGLLTWVLMSRTVIGRHLHALGGNEQAARLSGIQTDRLKWLAYCISAVLSSVAGILYICDQSIADPQTLGRGYELNAIAAAVVGGCSLQGGVGTIPGAVLGALFLRIVIDGVAKIIKTGADVYEGLIVGSVVVVAVALTRLRQAGQHDRSFLGGPLGIVTAVNIALLAGVLAVVFGYKKAGSIGLSPWLLGGGVAVLALVLLLVLRFLEHLAHRRKLKQPSASDKVPG
jgi:ribose/xylose/arabinose/galactoside ABC-type transport system permease subunit